MHYSCWYLWTKTTTIPRMLPTVKIPASGSMVVFEICIQYKELIKSAWVFTHSSRLWELILFIIKAYLLIEAICAECNLFSCSLFFARWLFNCVELELHLAARFNSDWCIASFLVFCLRNRIFNSVGLEWLGLEDKNNSALWSEFFLQRFFLIKGR